MIYYSVGTPIGKLNDNAQRYVYRQSQLFSMSVDAFSIWTRFLHGADVDAAYDRFKGKIEREAYQQIVNALIDTEMLLSEEQLKHAYCLRQGYGIGIGASTGESAIFCGSVCHVSYRAFLFWTYCDGQTTVENILLNIHSQTETVFSYQHAVSDIQELINRSLILIVN